MELLGMFLTQYLAARRLILILSVEAFRCSSYFTASKQKITGNQKPSISGDTCTLVAHSFAPNWNYVLERLLRGILELWAARVQFPGQY
jgi:hypothetical protein